MKTSLTGCCMAMIVAVEAVPAALGGVLLNNGSIPNGTGRKVSGVNVADGWTVYQAFDVPDGEGWFVALIGIDGWRVQDPPGAGQTGMICPDDGTGTAADCSNPIDLDAHRLENINPFESGWNDVRYNVGLAGNARYWFVSSANDANYWSSVYHAPDGLPSYSIRTSDGMRFDSGPTALRIQGFVGAGIPTVSHWGLAILILLVLTTGTILCKARFPCSQRP